MAVSNSGEVAFRSQNAFFCVEVCAKRAELSGQLHGALPGFFGVGTGCASSSAAPVVHTIPLSLDQLDQ